MPGCLSWLADNPDAIVSVHYLVTRDGKVYQIGRDTWAMWHAGRTLWSD
ncbi:MAG: N-acetylmuramoyl-L-alanine amidase [Actinobacteria bacterium]|nr:N-acetylmuramoyl-L-alanine amidase [Actinomycetota bacterium]